MNPKHAVTMAIAATAMASTLGAVALDVGQTRKASELFDVVLANGRVIDPETKLDAVRNVGIKNGHIAAVSKEELQGRQVVDVNGLVVAPGFIDWHAHGQNTLADRVQAFDGVTTSLELEAGMLPIGRWYDLQAKGSRVVNYGAASSWGVARMATLEGLPLPAEPKATALFANFGLTKWPNDVATPEQVEHIVNLTEQGLKEGGLGIGVVPGYAPGSGYKELLAVHTLAAKYNVPTYSHVRSEGDVDPLSAAQAYGEVLSFAAATAANVHICHLNSTSFRDMPLAVSMIHRGLEQGLKITVEAYPYEAASTAIGAKFLAPENLPRAGITYESVEYQGHRLNEGRFKELRANNPGAIVVVHFYELPRDQRLLDMAVLFPGGIIASDAMPWVSTTTGKEIDPNTWPLPEDAFSHPRSAGTFSRFLGQYVRERRAISLSDALAKTTYLPAKLLEQSVPQMSRKGRLQAGMDADIVVFDPALVRDSATYERPNQTSVGMRDVLVNGTFVIRDGALDTHAYPGQPVRRPVSSDVTTAVQARGLRGRAELEAFLDGMMAANMSDKHVAGATVSIVKDGALFFAKGYGYADADRRTPVDADRTLFRIGSVSKLFTWTAVMQLVEEGKLDLDVDVNRYLDFKIPTTYVQPITLRHMMTHTSGFEDDSRDILANDPNQVGPIGPWLASHIPGRVRPPGVFAAYSNYATALAAYVVQRVSGIPWEDDIEQRILIPLAMQHTSVRQPIPAALRTGMSAGYGFSKGRFDPKPWELMTGLAPAGAISASATDIARFMLAHLGDGAIGTQRILRAATVKQMHARAFAHDPRLPGFALGFYEQSSHGLRIIGHGGNTQWFHSDLTLIPSERLGIFVSYNTDTGHELNGTAFLREFLDHYYPTTRAAPVVGVDQLQQARRVAGEYRFNRMSYTTFQRALGLFSPVTVSNEADGSLLLASAQTGVMRLVPAGPWLYRDELGGDLVAFKTDASGRVANAFIGSLPMMVMERVAWYQSARLHRIVLSVAAAVFVLTVWSALARVLRRRFSQVRGDDTVPGRGFVVGAAFADLAFIVATAVLMSNATAFMTGSSAAFELALALPVVAIILAVVAAVSAVRQWGDHAGVIPPRLRYAAVVVTVGLFTWSLNEWNLFGWKF